jgi:hypothetical protein
MKMLKSIGRYDAFVAIGTSGRKEDVDYLMAVLEAMDDIATSKLVDFALSLVITREGIDRICYYLFNGTQGQRNYAALFLKRKGWVDYLVEAVEKGKIDRDQAFSV